VESIFLLSANLREVVCALFVVAAVEMQSLISEEEDIVVGKEGLQGAIQVIGFGIIG
jgi:hypothetical protein